jgi:excinuclease ABC subunit C
MKQTRSSFITMAHDAPESPGVYFFWNAKKLLYIGKATSLRDRIISYANKDIEQSRGPKIVEMVSKITRITWEPYGSVLEALLAESRLIKEHQPPYNTRDKDNKSYHMIAITKETLPRVLLVRERDIDPATKIIHPTQGAAKHVQIRSFFGPFPSGASARTALKILRKLFPFFDEKSTQSHAKDFYISLGLAPKDSEDSFKKNYEKNIKGLELFLSGKKNTLIERLRKTMHTHASKQEFEQADRIKKQIFALEHINDIALLKHETNTPRESFRIEAFDIAHLQGSNMVGVMTVLEHGEPQKSAYRKFIIRSVTRSNDTKALEEVLTRRFGHPGWGNPGLIVVDGGKAQKRVAERVCRLYGISVPIVAVVKDEKHKPKALLGVADIIETYKKQILLANAEAHRFAITYHKTKRVIPR